MYRKQKTTHTAATLETLGHATCRFAFCLAGIVCLFRLRALCIFLLCVLRRRCAVHSLFLPASGVQSVQASLPPSHTPPIILTSSYVLLPAHMVAASKTGKHSDSTDAISSKSAIVAYLIFTIIPSLLLLFIFSFYSYITIICLNTLPEQPSQAILHLQIRKTQILHLPSFRLPPYTPQAFHACCPP